MKKFLVCLLLLSMALTILPVSALVSANLQIGDINGNGEIDSMDYLYLKRAFFKQYVLDDISVGDINGNGKIDSMDYLYLKRAFFKQYVITNDDVVDDDSTSTPVEPPSDEDSSGSDPNENVDFEVIDWGGVEVNILGHSAKDSYATYQIDTEEPNDDALINAFYERNKYIKDNCGIEINVILPESGEDPIGMFREDLMSGIGEYNAIVGPFSNVAPLACDGMLADLNSLDTDYLKLNRPWWDQSLINDVNFNNKVYFLSGDALVTDDESTWAMFFNKDLIEEHNLENPYDLVYNGDWTLDKMYEMLQEVDLTHGTTKSYEPEVGDQWGMVAQSYDFSQFMLGAGQRMVDNSMGDVPMLRILNEENVTTFSKIADWFINDSKNIGVADYNGSWTSGIYEKELQIFANGNALFMPNNIATASGSYLTESNINYGIVPMPKGSKSQANYNSGVNPYNFAVLGISKGITGDRLDATCYALEAMAYFGNKMVKPEYYNKVLSHKNLKDEDSVAMLDKIFDNRIFDLGTIYNLHRGSEFEGTTYFYSNLLGEKSTNIVSTYLSKEGNFQTGLDALIEKCYK